MTNLCIDIGNTQIKYVVYRDRKIVSVGRRSHGEINWHTLLDESPIDAIAVSNVTSRRDYSILSQKVSLYIDLDEHTPIPFANHYETPQTLGHDRIAAVCGAYALDPSSSHCVIDIGTCMTLDFLHVEQGFLGGNISPGVDMRLQAMHTFTDGLPMLGREDIQGLLGVSTVSAMLQGAVHGCLYEIEGFILRLKEVYENFNVILTGGGGQYFAGKLKTKTFVEENLIPLGLNYILHEAAS